MRVIARVVAPLRSPWGLAAALLIYGNLNSLVPWEVRGRYLLWANLLLLAVLLFEAVKVSDFSFRSLGLTGRGWRRSVLLGAASAVALAALPVGFVVLAPFLTGDPVEYGDIGELSGGALAFRLAFWEPVGTAFFEEAAFRGILYAKFSAVSTERRAVVMSSIVFALWHVVITTRTVVESDVVGIAWLLPPAALVSLAGTFVGGLVFAWLRWRTGHLAGPFLVHWLAVALMSLAVWVRA